MKKLYIAIPSHDNRCHFPMAFGLLEMYSELSKRGIHINPALHSKTSAARGRNNLFSDFLDSDCDALLFIDTDMHIKGKAKEMVNMVLRPHLIVGAMYPQKTTALRWVMNPIPGETVIESGDNAGLVKVDKLGTGGLRIRREAIEAIIAKMPEIAYVEDDVTGNGKTKYGLCQETVVYDPIYGKMRWMTDDWYFCHLARKCGIDIWADTTFYLKHEGDCVYPIVEPEVKQLG